MNKNMYERGADIGGRLGQGEVEVDLKWPSSVDVTGENEISETIDRW